MIETGIVIAGWKTIKALYEGYQNWSIRSKKSKEAKMLQARAEELIGQINMGILSGKSSDDPTLAPLIREFKQLLAKDVKPSDADRTVDWINLSGSSRTGNVLMGPAKAAARPAAKKAAAKPAAKRAAAKPAAKRAAAKPAAKRAAAKPAAKRAAAKPAAKRAAAKPAAKKR